LQPSANLLTMMAMDLLKEPEILPLVSEFKKKKGL
jgi:hypothetical protein